MTVGNVRIPRTHTVPHLPLLIATADSGDKNYQQRRSSYQRRRSSQSPTLAVAVISIGRFET